MEFGRIPPISTHFSKGPNYRCFTDSYGVVSTFFRILADHDQTGSQKYRMILLKTKDWTRALGQRARNLELRNVERALRPLVQSGIPRLEEVAEILKTSPRSLQRFLAHQNVSFSEMVHKLRQETAERLLRDTELPISEIVERMGQTDVSNFGRSFRKWTGQSPANWRKQQFNGKI